MYEDEAVQKFAMIRKNWQWVMPLMFGGALVGIEYEDYFGMKDAINNIDIAAIEARNQQIETKLNDAIDYTRDIKDGLRDDIISVEGNIDRVIDKLREIENEQIELYNLTRDTIRRERERLQAINNDYREKTIQTNRDARDKMERDHKEALQELEDKLEKFEEELDEQVAEIESRIEKKVQYALDNPLAQ